jgi:hypothetical protein
MLFIRACKSDNAEKRIQRIYNSVYLRSNYPDYQHFSRILMRIVIENNLISMERLITEYLDPRQAWKFGGSEDEDYYVRVFRAMISIIRLTEVSKLVNFIPPVRFRRK